MANYLVTGGCGFIGSHLVDHLVEQGEGVRVLDDLSTGRRSNLAESERLIEFVQGDIRDSEVIARAVEDMDYVLHQAAIPSVPRSVEEPVGTSEVNVLGTIRLLDACARAGVKRVVIASSSSVYGERPEPAKHESMLPSTLSPYAAAKFACEKFCEAFGASRGLETVALRYFNVFGPRQDPNSPYSAVIPKFLERMTAGLPPHIHGDGLQSRDFTYVENVVHANLLAIHAGPEAVGRAFNVASGHSYSLLNLVRELNALLGTEIEPEFGPPRVGDIRHSLADINAARSALGYDVRVEFGEGLRRTVEAWRS